MATIEITNFGGSLTRKLDGSVNSGRAKYTTSWGYDPYSKPNNLTWMEQPTSILTNVLLVAMKARSLGTASPLIYSIDSVSNLRTTVPNNINGPDVEIGLTSLLGTAGTDTFLAGGGMTFYGATEKIFFGGDQQVMKINFDGSSPSVIFSDGLNGPRPFVNFVGRVYFATKGNIGEIDSTETVSNAAKLSPALPSGLFIKDLDLSPNGNYMQITASRTNPLNAVSADALNPTPNVSDSYKFYWNGIDNSYSSIDNYSGLVLSANVISGNKSYIFGYDSDGVAIFQGSQKEVVLPEVLTPQSNAVFSTGNIICFAAREYEKSISRMRVGLFHYGSYDKESPHGLFRLLRHNAQVNNDILSVPACTNVSNKMYYPQQQSFVGNLGATSKVYYSTVEGSPGGVANVTKLWRFDIVPSGVASIVAGVYETQTQLFSKKMKVSEVRVYTEPLVGGNDFTVDLIGSGGSVLSGGSQRFQVATGSIVTLSDMVSFNPAAAPTYALGVRITNASVTGVANWVAHKIEIDVEPAGR